MGKGNFLMGTINGKIGDLVFMRRNGEQIQRAYVKPKNAMTRSQYTQRSQITNIVRLYQASPSFFQKAFENKPTNQSDYNALVSRNLGKDPKVYLPKEVAEAGGGVAAPYLITDGTLQSILVSGVGADAVTNIAIGELEITPQLTVAELSAAILANNTFIEAGDQISYISIEQYQDNGIPKLRLRKFELVVNTAAEGLVTDYWPVQALANKEGFIGHGDLVYTGAFAWVLSRVANGKLKVSRQRLVLTAQNINTNFTSSDAITRAQVSYGAALPIFLDPNSDAAGSTVPSVGASVASVRLNDTDLNSSSDFVGASTTIAAGKLIIQGSGLSEVESCKVTLRYFNSDDVIGDGYSEETKEVALTAESDVLTKNSAQVDGLQDLPIYGVKIIFGVRTVFSWGYNQSGGTGGGGGQDPSPLD